MKKNSTSINKLNIDKKVVSVLSVESDIQGDAKAVTTTSSTPLCIIFGD